MGTVLQRTRIQKQGETVKLTDKEKLLLEEIGESIDYWKDHGDECITKKHLNLINKLISTGEAGE